MMKKIVILGSTGSIGTQTLDIVRENPDKFKVSALTCGHNIDLLAKQIREFRPSAAAVMKQDDAEKLREEFPETEIYYGREGIIYAASETECDIVVNALVGMAGLEPTYYAIQAGRTIALANKETLVAGGSVIMDAAASNGVKILPVDSEHSAVFQCLEGYDHSQVKRIILTASGGPFRGKTKAELEDVTLEQALNHPRWKMGSKITIDSSTLMNKGFEVIEARWLFDVPASDIDVVIHPESIIHSMVEYDDRAVMAQLGLPDMKIPISLALSYPKRLPNTMPSLDLTDISALTFEKPDTDTFVCLKLAYDALAAGDTYCTALNAANEVCVAAFLEGKIRYRDIGETLMHIMDIHIPSKRADLNEILRTDAAVREQTAGLLAKL
jgi:1-deoxy-D-xylulose-5-phosphate reductoisomerase